MCPSTRFLPPTLILPSLVLFLPASSSLPKLTPRSHVSLLAQGDNGDDGCSVVWAPSWYLLPFSSLFTISVSCGVVRGVVWGRGGNRFTLGTLDGTAPKEDYEFIRRAMLITDLAETLMPRNPADVTPEEFQPLADAVAHATARGDYHVRKTMEM